LKNLKSTEISRKLTDLNIPCNVVAGYYHDHLFIPEAMLEKAISIFPKSGIKTTV